MPDAEYPRTSASCPREEAARSLSKTVTNVLQRGMSEAGLQVLLRERWGAPCLIVDGPLESKCGLTASHTSRNMMTNLLAGPWASMPIFRSSQPQYQLLIASNDDSNADKGGADAIIEIGKMAKRPG